MDSNVALLVLTGVAIAVVAVLEVSLVFWATRNAPEPSHPIGRLRRPPEDYMEEELASLDMHYGDEPLYYSDPPEWPTEG